MKGAANLAGSNRTPDCGQYRQAARLVATARLTVATARLTKVSIPHEACPAGDGNGKIGRQAAYLPDRCLRDGVGGRNGNSRLLAAQFSAPKLIFDPDKLFQNRPRNENSRTLPVSGIVRRSLYV